LIQLTFLFLFGQLCSQSIFADENKIEHNLTIISLYQLEDDVHAGFDFFTSKNHINVAEKYQIDIDPTVITQQ
jgi:hypothetical protein